MSRLYFLAGFALAVLVSTFEASANEFHLVLNGKAVHFKKDGDNREFNEKNYGLGFVYNFDSKTRWVPFVSGSSFLDSNKDRSNYFGIGYKYQLAATNKKSLNVGLMGFVMTRKDYKDNKPFLGALPFVSIGFNRLTLNMTYVPEITPKSVPFAYFQLMYKLW